MKYYAEIGALVEDYLSSSPIKFSRRGKSCKKQAVSRFPVLRLIKTSRYIRRIILTWIVSLVTAVALFAPRILNETRNIVLGIAAFPLPSSVATSTFIIH